MADPAEITGGEDDGPGLRHSRCCAVQEDTEAAGRQVDLYWIAGRELEAVDVPVEHQRRDGRVAAEGDAGQWPRGNDLPDLCGEAAIGWRIGCRGPEVDVFGPVEGVHWATQPFGCMAEDELPDPDGAASRRAVSEF